MPDDSAKDPHGDTPEPGGHRRLGPEEYHAFLQQARQNLGPAAAPLTAPAEPQTPDDVKAMAAKLATRLANTAGLYATLAHTILDAGNTADAKIALAKSEAYEEAAALVLTIARNL